MLVGLLATFASRSQPQRPSSSLPGPTEHLSDRSAGFPAQLDYFSRTDDSLLVFGLGETGDPVAPSPPLAVQGQVLDRLLGEFTSHHARLPETIAVRFGASRRGLVEALDRELMRPGADWDAARGRPRHGQFGEVLQTMLANVVAHSALARAFVAHGYRLSLTGMNRTEIDAVPTLGGAKLPTEITVMQFEARRLPKKG